MMFYVHLHWNIDVKHTLTLRLLLPWNILLHTSAKGTDLFRLESCKTNKSWCARWLTAKALSESVWVWLQAISVGQERYCVDRAPLMAFCPHIFALDVSGSCSRTLVSSATHWPYVRVAIQFCVWTNESVCMSCCLGTVFVFVCACMVRWVTVPLTEIVWLSLSLVCLPTNQIWRVTETHGCPGREVMLRNELSDT